MHRLGIYGRLYRLAQQYTDTLPDMEALSDAAIEFCAAIQGTMQSRAGGESSIYMRGHAEKCSNTISDILPKYQALVRQLQQELSRTLSRQSADVLSPSSDHWDRNLVADCMYLASLHLYAHQTDFSYSRQGPQRQRTLGLHSFNLGPTHLPINEVPNILVQRSRGLRPAPFLRPCRVITAPTNYSSVAKSRSSSSRVQIRGELGRVNRGALAEYILAWAWKDIGPHEQPFR